jgi:head-tail adaptor
MLRSGALRHRVAIKRPPSGDAALGARGERTGAATTICAEWPCAVTRLSGRELEQARQTVATATHRVVGYADPDQRIVASDYLEFQGRTLAIQYVGDADERDFETMLLCAEEI